VLYAKELPARSKYREVANDFNSDLINLHRCIRSNPLLLQKYLNELLISRELFSDNKIKQYETTRLRRESSILFLSAPDEFWKQGR